MHDTCMLADKHEPCVMIKGAREIVLNLKEKGRETQTFKFDAVMPEATQQQEIFERECTTKALRQRHSLLAGDFLLG